MGSITSGVGLVSGINYTSLVDQLMQLEAQPKTRLQTRIDKVNQVRLAYTDISMRLSSMKLTATTLKKPSTFAATTASSSNQNVLTATTGLAAAVGSYQFRVTRMVTAQQTISRGYGAADSGSLGQVRQSVPIDGSEEGLQPNVPLAWLRGGLGVPNGAFTITNKAGQKATVNTAGATTLQQVAGLINSTNLGVKASFTKEGFELVDSSGGTGSLSVQDLNNGTTASQLGIAGSTTGTSLATGDLRYLTNVTQLSSLNGGMGVRTAGGGSPDFTITTADGTSHAITLGSAVKNVQQVMDAITTQTGGAVTVAKGGAHESNLVLTDTTIGGSTFTVAAAGSSKAAADLGLLQASSGNTITGTDIQAAYNTAQLVGKLTVEMGGGEINSPTQLSQLNGGAGVRRGVFRITDRSGASTNIDISAALTLDDVVRQINGQIDVGVRAEIKGDGLVLKDLTGRAVNDLMVRDLGDGKAAADLGIVQSVAGDTLTGSSINYLGNGTALSAINDGRGLRTVGAGKTDLRIEVGTDQFDISLDGAKTIGDVLAKINNAAPGRIQASVAADGKSLKLMDLSNSGSMTVSAQNGSKAAADLGLLGTTASDTIEGSRLMAGLGTVLLSSLNGGVGFTFGKISIKDRAGNSDTADLSGCKSVQEVLDTLNALGVARIKASLKPAGNGIQIEDASGQSGDLVIGDADGLNSATTLGIAGTFDTSYASVQGANLQRQWLHEGVALAQMNGGRGITAGQFRITNAKGITADVDLTNAANLKLGDVISAINGAGIGVTASLNKQGDGLLLMDTTGGAGKLKVDDLGSTTAADLRIRGEGTVKSGATSPTIDGSYEKTFTITAADTLQSLSDRVNAAGFGVSATILDDGSPATPFRLSLTARNSGRAGRVVIDSGAAELGMGNLVEAQDAAVFVGSGGGGNTMLVTSSTNSITKVIPGVTLNIQGTSDQPVTINITRSIEDVTKKLGEFVEAFNTMTEKIAELTKFDLDQNKRGILLGDSTLRTVQQKVYAVFSSVVSGGGKYRTMGDIGLKLAEGAKLEFDQEKFQTAFANDATSFQKFFSLTQTVSGKVVQDGFGARLETAMNELVKPLDGVISRSNTQLDAQVKQWTDRMKQLDGTLERKRMRLQKQFAGLEGTLAKLQGQQSSLNQWATQVNRSK